MYETWTNNLAGPFARTGLILSGAGLIVIGTAADTGRAGGRNVTGPARLALTS
jgi:hypothetical protein